jgi:hypothetical protein
MHPLVVEEPIQKGIEMNKKKKTNKINVQA